MRRLAMFSCLLLFVAVSSSCGGVVIGGPNGGTNGDGPSFDFVMGTGVTSTSDSVRTAFGVWLDFAPEDVPPDGATLRLYGPPGWSFGPRTFQMTSAMIASGFSSGTSTATAMPGNYSVELDLKDGTVLTAGPKSLPSVDTVALPSGLTFTGLALEAGTYFVTVNAQPIDRLADPIPMVDRYDTAQTRSDNFDIGP